MRFRVTAELSWYDDEKGNIDGYMSKFSFFLGIHDRFSLFNVFFWIKDAPCECC